MGGLGAKVGSGAVVGWEGLGGLGVGGYGGRGGGGRGGGELGCRYRW